MTINVSEHRELPDDLQLLYAPEKEEGADLLSNVENIMNSYPTGKVPPEVLITLNPDEEEALEVLKNLDDDKINLELGCLSLIPGVLQLCWTLDTTRKILRISVKLFGLVVFAFNIDLKKGQKGCEKIKKNWKFVKCDLTICMDWSDMKLTLDGVACVRKWIFGGWKCKKYTNFVVFNL